MIDCCTNLINTISKFHPQKTEIFNDNWTHFLFHYTLFLPEFKLYSCICPPHERVRSWCRLYTRTIDCIVSIRWLNPECIDRQCLSSEWTDWQLPIIWRFQRRFVWKYHARVRQCPLYKELFNREMHLGDVSMAVISRCPLSQVWL
jgi:hypothetical protein